MRYPIFWMRLTTKQLQAKLNVSASIAESIAIDQLSKLAGNILQHECIEVGLDLYKWSTCKDSGVRKSNAVLEGKICSWHDEGIYKDKVTDKGLSFNNLPNSRNFLPTSAVFNNFYKI